MSSSARPARRMASSTAADGELRLTAIHGASRFDTEWLEGADPVWTSKPG